MGPTADDANPWSTHRRRAEELRGRYPFAAEMLGLYLARCSTSGARRGRWPARTGRPRPSCLTGRSASALPRVVKVTEAAGPAALVGGGPRAGRRRRGGRLPSEPGSAGSDPPPVQTYLAHACLRPGWSPSRMAGEACAADPAPRGGQHCPRCGGRPQLSFRAAAGDQLVSGGRHLCCGRCGHAWSFSASTCPSCGETAGARRTLYAEQRDGPVVGPVGPDDGGPDDGATLSPRSHRGVRQLPAVPARHRARSRPAAVPEVDELAAVPLALYAARPGTYEDHTQPDGVLMVEITPGQAYGFFTDTSVCIGCKACEVACKEWNQLPGNEPVFGDGYDNTGQLDAQNWRHVQFIDRVPDETSTVGQGKAWLMMSDVCKHCTHASCMDVCPTDAIIKTEFDTVYIQPDVCNGCRDCISACPYGVIEMDQNKDVAQKCTLCYDRLQGGLEPACAKACPTQSIQFGPVKELRLTAVKRVDALHAAGRCARHACTGPTIRSTAGWARSSCSWTNPRCTGCPTPRTRYCPPATTPAATSPRWSPPWSRWSAV